MLLWKQVLAEGQTEILYSLYGIVEHSGTMRSGHYTAYVKVRPRGAHTSSNGLAQGRRGAGRRNESKRFVFSKPVGSLQRSLQEMQRHREAPGFTSATRAFSLWAKVKSRAAKPTSSSTRDSSDQKPRQTTQEIQTNQHSAAAAAAAAASPSHYRTQVDQKWPPSRAQYGLNKIDFA